ncbi:MAG: SpoIID/LytB domain-containing protein [Actinobacteria bacterium]|nr:SpoIID/LytB domain-containing protein [Actinomycetota bacterium]
MPDNQTEGSRIRALLGVLVLVQLIFLSAFASAAGLATPRSGRSDRLTLPVDALRTGQAAVPETIKVLMPDGNVETMDMDEYLKGVVPTEVGASWPYDSLAAQAVAARSFAATAHRHPEVGADVCTTTHCQAYNPANRDERTDLAVDSTHKVAALYQGDIIHAYYFGHCDGHTRNSEDVWGGYLPYCRSVSCPCGYTEMWGHGVGMCQEGVKVLAEAGWDYGDILEHYYTGVDVESTEPVAMTWYFAEGTTRPGFDTYLCMGNPSDAEAHLTVSYLVEGGGNKDASYTVEPGSRKTIDTSKDIGADKDFSCRVSVDNDVGIVVERPMYFNYQGAWTGGHDTMGTPYPKSTWYFAEGTTRPGFDTYLCMGNPSEKGATVSITYIRGDGTTERQDVMVLPLSRKTVSANDFLGTVDGPADDTAVYVEVTNNVGIVVERPMYFSYKGDIPGGHNTIGR